MRLENNLKNRFVKDYNLPIKVVREVKVQGKCIDSFYYFIEKLDPYYKTTEKLRLFQNFLNKCHHDGEDFFHKTNEIIKKAQENIHNKALFNEFKNCDLKEKLIKTPNYNLNKSKYLLIENDGETFVSIDLKQANFQSIRYYSPSLVNNKSDFKDYILEFTDDPYILESKKIRQIIFGDKIMNPKRQQQIQRSIINNVIHNLIVDGYILEDTKMEVTSDEIVLKKKDFLKNIDHFFKNLPNELKEINFHIKEFKIELLKTREKLPENIFLRHDTDSEIVKIKNCPARYIPEVVTFLESNRDIELYKKNLNYLDRLGFEAGRIFHYEDFLFSD